MKPVEIEFLMRDKLTGDLGRAAKQIESLDETAQSAGTSAEEIRKGLAQIGAVCEEQERKIGQLSESFDEWGRRAVAAAKAGKEEEARAMQERQEMARKEKEVREELLRQARETSNELEKLAEKEEEETKSTNENAQAHQSLRSRIKELKAEMALYREAHGDQTEAYRKMSAELGRLTDIQGDISTQARVFSNDQANFQGVIQGLNGVVGGFSAATGALSLFSAENENLQKAMLKVQSLMAITTGLQQVSQALNKDSAFVLVTLRKAKELLAVAEGKVAAAMGVSTVAARVLMATLTLGLSVAITALIVAYEKFSAKQEEAAAKLKATIEVEHEARLTQAKARLELEQNIATLKTFNGTKDQEKKKVEELNQKYGESFGYHQTTAEWYDVLIQKGQAYAQVLFLQAKMQTLANRAAEAQVKADELERQDPNNAETSMAWYEKAWVLTKKAGFTWSGSGAVTKALADINQENKKRQGDAVRENRKVAEDAKREMDATRKQIEDVQKDFGLGGHSAPTKPKKPGKTQDPFLAELQARKAEYDRFHQWVNSGDEELLKRSGKEFEGLLKGGKSYIDYLKRQRQQLLDKPEGSLTKVQQHQLKLINNELAANITNTELQDFETALRTKLEAAQTTLERLGTLQTAKAGLQDDSSTMADEKRKLIEKEEKAVQEKLREEHRTRMSNYASLLDRQIQLKTAYNEDVLALERELSRSTNAEEQARIRRTLATRKEAYTQELAQLLTASREEQRSLIDIEQESALQVVAARKYLWETDREQHTAQVRQAALKKELELLRQVQAVAPTPQVEHEIKRITLAVQELDLQIDKLKDKKLQEVFNGLDKITGALAGIGGELGNVMSSINSSVGALRTAFDSKAGNVDKLSAGLSSIVGIIGMISSASEQRKEKEREFYQNQIALVHEYALALNEVLRTKANLSGGGFIEDYTGKIKSSFDALTDASKNYREAISKLADGRVKTGLRNAIDMGNVAKGAGLGAAAGAAIGSVVPVIGTAIGAVVGGVVGLFSGIFGGKKKKEVYGGLLQTFPELVSATGELNTELAKSLISTNKLDASTKQLLQNALAWEEAQKKASEQVDEVIKSLAGDVGNTLRTALVESWKAGEDGSRRMFEAAEQSLEKFVEQMLYSLLFSDTFSKFRDRLKKSLSPDGDGNVIDDYKWLMEQMQSGKKSFTQALDQLKKAGLQEGFDLFNPSSQKQQAKPGDAFKALTQEQGTKLEGLFTAGQMHWASIDKTLASASVDMRTASATLLAIKEDTVYLRYLRPMADDIAVMLRDGLKIK